ncbi:hypothetical protein SRHO_G00154160 [Serrasalmus rhombeus]
MISQLANRRTNTTQSQLRRRGLSEDRWDLNNNPIPPGSVITWCQCESPCSPEPEEPEEPTSRFRRTPGEVGAALLKK